MRRIQLAIRLWRLCEICVRGPSNVGRTVQTDPTLLRYAPVITEQKKCWELLAQNFDRFQTLRDNSQQASNNIHQHAYNRVCKRTQRTLLHVTCNNVASFCKGFKGFKNWEDETPLESENMKISIALNSLFPEFYTRFDQFCLVTFNSTPWDTHFPRKSGSFCEYRSTDYVIQ